MFGFAGTSNRRRKGLLDSQLVGVDRVAFCVLLAVAENSKWLLESVAALLLCLVVGWWGRWQEPVIRLARIARAEIHRAKVLVFFLGTDEQPSRVEIVHGVSSLLRRRLRVALTTRRGEVAAHSSVVSDASVAASAILLGLRLGEVGLQFELGWHRFTFLAADTTDSRSAYRGAIFTARGGCVMIVGLSCSKETGREHFGLIDSFETDHAYATIIPSSLRPVLLLLSFARDARSLTRQG